MIPRWVQKRKFCTISIFEKKADAKIRVKPWKKEAPPAGLEPATNGLTVRSANSYINQSSGAAPLAAQRIIATEAAPMTNEN